MTADQTTTPSGHYVGVNGIDIYYESYGRGAPLLLLHGGTGNHSMWTPYIPRFAQHFRVLAPDSRGHGRTSNPAASLSYRMLAEDMVAFSQALKLEKPAVCGYSDGGQVALEMAMHAPHLASAYVISGAAHRWSDRYAAWIQALGIAGPGVVDFAFLQRQHPDLIADLQERQDAFQGPGYWKRYLREISMMWLEPLDYALEMLQQIAAPTLIVSGDRDETFLPIELAVELYRNMRQSELAVIPGMGHELPFEEPTLFSEVILRFFRRHQLLP